MPDNLSLYHRVVAAREGQPPHPTLLLLHGRGSHELDLLGLAPEMDRRFFVVSARAPYDFYEGYAWYQVTAPGQQDRPGFEHSLGLLQAFVGELATAYPIDPARLFPLGFSQGSMMANALTLSAPDKVAGAVLLSGAQPRPENLTIQGEAVRGKPVFLAHGTRDEVLDVSMGRAVRETLTELGLDLTYREYDTGHQVTLDELADLKVWLTSRLEAPV